MYCSDVDIVVEAQHDALTRFGHALSDSTRTQVLVRLRHGGGAYPADLAEAMGGVSRQTLSNHLACLRGGCGLVVAIPEGRRSRYELADSRIGHALDDLLGWYLRWMLRAAPRRLAMARISEAARDLYRAEMAAAAVTGGWPSSAGATLNARTSCPNPTRGYTPRITLPCSGSLCASMIGAKHSARWCASSSPLRGGR